MKLESKIKGVRFVGRYKKRYEKRLQKYIILQDIIKKKKLHIL